MQQHSNILRKKSSNFNYLQAIFLIILSCLHITNLFIKPKYTYAVNNLNLFIGSNYIADETISRYEKSCNCHLEQNFFNDNEEMLAKIIAGATGYDVIVATTYAVEELAKMHKILPLDHSKIYNLNQINTKFLNQDFDPNNRYSIPYAYTPSFLAYNVNKLKELNITPNTWAIVFDPKYLQKLKGHITMFNSMRHVFAAALMYLGLDPNSNNIEDLKKARDVINKASAYWVKFDSDSYYRGLLRGDIWVSQAYSNDIFKTILDAKNSNSPIKIAGMLQKEGNMYELDNIVIPINQNNNSSKASAKSNLAMQNIYKFINNSLDKQSEYELSLATGSSIMNTQALKILKANKPDIINTDWIYPQDMQKMHTFTAYDPKIRILANSLWTEIQMQCNYVN